MSASKLLKKIRSAFGAADRSYFLEKSRLDLELAEFLRINLHESPAYKASGKLNLYERKVFSQAGEDGILDEIFARIGTTRKTFIEFGVEDGRECNTTYLLVKGWRGVWLEGDPKRVASMKQEFKDALDAGRLRLRHAFITRDNIDGILADLGTQEVDLLSIDIDGNDYWVWDAIRYIQPRVVVIEYNAKFPPTCDWVMAYDATYCWSGTSHFGASLKALERLGREKGYDLVACSFSGVNAFFVRRDAAAGKFTGPFTAEHMYEPPRYFLTHGSAGHPSAYGPAVVTS